jgi:hypothetical protein
MSTEEEGRWSITPAALYELINKKRRQLNKTPIDHGTMTTRLVLKCNVAHPGSFDFDAPKMALKSAEISVLEKIVNEQFDLYLNNELQRHCTSLRPAPAPAPPKPVVPKPLGRMQDLAPKSGGLKSKLKGLFGR